MVCKIDRQIGRQIDRWMDGQIDGWMDRWMDGSMDGWIDEIDRQNSWSSGEGNGKLQVRFNKS